MSEGFSHYMFLDIETVPHAPVLSDLDEYSQELWEEKEGKKREENTDADEYYFSRAGIYSEFGKIICISVGYFKNEGGEPVLRIKSCFGHDEKKVLTEFFELLDAFHRRMDKLILCGHNIKEFDIPYICRRAIVNHLHLPVLLADLQGKKPWEVPLEDTMLLWKFGDVKNYTSLKLMSHILGIPSSKDDINGSQVAYVYWHEEGLDRIKDYCQKDVSATAQVFLRLKFQPPVRPENVLFLS